MNQTVTKEQISTDEVDRITYEGSHFPLWMLIMWVAFIAFMTFYMIRFFVPNLDTWVKKPPVSHFEP